MTGASQEIIPSSAVRVVTKISSYQLHKIIGSLSNNDGDIDENGKKAIGLDWQNNNVTCASCFFVHFFAVTA